jgi:hypothetical protein
LIADHSAKAGDGISVGKTFHRIEEGHPALRRRVFPFIVAVADPRGPASG